MEAGIAAEQPSRPWGMDRYQWLVLATAWLGWGFDIFDGLLFNLVAPSAVPVLLGLPLGSPAAKSAALLWTGVMTSVLLVGWAAGGIVFGHVADRIGRSRTLVLTMLVYSFGTAACAFAPTIWALLACRVVASLGIGGEWAAGAAMVAEVVPERRRVAAGALLFTASPFGFLLATLVNWLVTGLYLQSRPEVAWRWVLLAGIVPAGVALLARAFLREPERWQAAARDAAPPRIGELFDRRYRALTRAGFLTVAVSLITWWTCNAFIPIIATGLAQSTPGFAALDPAAGVALVERWKTLAITYFNLGGLAGALLTIPVARALGRRPMYGLYFLGSALSVAAGFGLDLPAEVRLAMYFPVGATVFGIGSSFAFYLPELFPTRLRGTGAGFCYNSARVLAAVGPFLVGSFAAQGAGSLANALAVLSWVAAVPLLGLAFLPWVVETRGRDLAD